MNRNQKIGLGIVLGMALLFAATVAWAASTVVSDGLVTVQVDEGGPGGTHFYLPIPGSAVRAAAVAVRWDGEPQRRLRAGLAEIEPVLRGLADELEACPDVKLVEIESDREHVVIEKLGGSLRIRIHDGHDRVRISVPVSLVSDLLDHFAAAV